MSLVVNGSGYSTAGNGGRKLVRLSNGWLVAGIIDADYVGDMDFLLFYISKDNGNTWNFFARSQDRVEDGTGVALVSNGLTFHAITICDNDIRLYNFDATTSPPLSSGVPIIPLGAYTTKEYDISSVSLAIDPTNGHLHVVWSSKNSLNPNAFNIRYAKSTDGGITLGGLTQVTNFMGSLLANPSIVVRNGTPIILFDSNAVTNSITCYRLVDSKFIGGPIYDGGSYVQQSPSAVVDKDGVIHVAWHGKDNTSLDNSIRYSKSTDGGVSWSNVEKISKDGYESTVPSITVDKENKINLFYVLSLGTVVKAENINGSWINSGWGTPGNYPSTLYDPTFVGTFGSIPSVIYQTSTGVEYQGTYTLNNAPTLTLNTADNFTLSETEEGNKVLAEGSTLDVDANNTVTVKCQINDGTIRSIASGISDGHTPINFSRLLTYSNKRIYDGATPMSVDLAENVDHKLKVWADDGAGGISVIAERKFRVNHNRPPVISGADEDLGTLIQTPSITYQVNDLEGNGITVVEKINGQVLRTFAATANTDYTLSIPLDTWIPLQLQQHTLVIEAIDSMGARSFRTYTFTRTEDTILLELKEPFLTDIAATRILVTPDVYIPIGSTILIEACNNAFDTEPTWEDITNMAMGKRGYSFTNSTKTAEDWGINIRFTLKKGTATQQVRLEGFGGAFD